MENNGKPSTRRNVVANFVGRAWGGVLLILLVPTYVHYLGIESYGLVGFFATMQGVFILADLGLSTTLNRELARLSVSAANADRMNDLVRTFEVIYWSGAAVIAVLSVAIAPVLARYWIHAQHLSMQTVQASLGFMGVAVALQLPWALYTGALQGLQRQVEFNVIVVLAATIRLFGGLMLVIWVWRSITGYFAWNLAAIAAQTAAAALLVWRVLPKRDVRPCLRLDLIRELGAFASGLAIVSILSVLLMQTDKVVLSYAVSLKTFGYYSVAASVASGLYVLAQPIFNGVFPRMAQLVVRGETEELASLYHTSAQLVATAVLPVAVVLITFAPEVLAAWTHSPEMVAESTLVLRLLIAGTALHALSHIPYALQLAHGWTALTAWINAFGVLLLVPLTYFGAKAYGGPGAAAGWLILNCGYVIVGIQIMHKKLLRSEKGRWYRDDVLLPLAGASVVVVLGRSLMAVEMAEWKTVMFIGCVGVLAVVAAGVGAQSVRTFAWAAITRSRTWKTADDLERRRAGQ